jgi:outer membrane protein TolC
MALTGSYSYVTPTAAFGPKNLTWTVTLAANLPIFDGGTTAAKVAQARSDLRSAQAGREQLRQGIALDVRQAYLSVREAQARLEATAKSVEEAREAVRLAEARYAAGVGTSVEVTDAVAAFTGASTNNVTAIYDARISLARLDNAVGAPIGPGATGAAK